MQVDECSAFWTITDVNSHLPSRKPNKPGHGELGIPRSFTDLRVLVKKGDPDSPLYSHAETIHRDGWAKDADGMRDAAIYGVDMVVTPEEYRSELIDRFWLEFG